MSSIPFIALLLLSAPRPQETPPPGELRFGGPFVVRIEGSALGLRAGDFDGDGLTDLAVVNNDKARIELLLQRPRGREIPPAPGEKEVNVPADDPLFEKRSLLTERRIGGFVTGDFNGDGKADLAWYGDPKGLVVAFQGEKGSFSNRREFALDDGSQSAHALQAGDLDGDGRTDLVLLAENEIVVIRQGAAGLREPERIPAAGENLGYVRLGDFNGDGRQDLMFADNNAERPVRFRFQRSDGGLGPEISFRCPAVRSLRVLPEDPEHGFLMIPQASGTLRRVHLAPEATPEGGIALGLPQVHPFAAKAADRGVAAAGDLDGDGRIDVLVGDPGAARVLLFRQTAAGDLAGPEPFPSFKEVSGVRIADFAGDGRREAAVMSKEEKSVGLQAWDGRRLSFPRPVAVEGTPQALEAADVDGDGATDLVVAVKDKKAARLLVRWGGREAETRAPLAVDLQPPAEIEGLRATDLDGDGRVDLVVFVPFEAPRVFKGRDGPALEEVPAASLFREASLQGLSEAATSLGDLDGDGRPELLFAKESFARAARLDAGRGFTVIDQVNGPAGAKTLAAAALDLDGRAGAECVLLDANAKALRVMSRSASGTYGEVRKVDLDDTEFKGLLVADVTGDGRDDLVVLGGRKFAVIAAGQAGLATVEDQAYESAERDAFLTLLQVADLGGPPGAEVIAVDGGNHAIEILSSAGGSWKRLRGWKVFEAKSYEHRGGEGGQEPHDLLTADVTGDGKPDIVVLAHDRVVVYPRE